jgi:hypothetical protein
MAILFAVLLAAAQGSAPPVVGHYQAVTETEYAIELQLSPSGQAQLEFRTWEADDPQHPTVQRFKGSWLWSGANVTIRFKSGRSATFAPVPCLSYKEFAQQGCSPGLKLVTTTFPKQYGLQRFGLWRSDALRAQL